MSKMFNLMLPSFYGKTTILETFSKLGIFHKYGTSRNYGFQHPIINCQNCLPKIYKIKRSRNNTFKLQCQKDKFYGTECPKNSSSKEPICTEKPSKWPSGVKTNFKFHPDTEAIMNEHINAEFKAFYCYLSMASYFGRVDVALPGCESFFIQMHHEEHDHALKLMNYVKLRGGSVSLCPIKPPDNQDWQCPLNAFKTALELEMVVTEKLVSVNSVAEKHGDLNASDFIITYYMEDQMKSINEIARLITLLSGVGDNSLARFIFDKELLENYVMSDFNVLKNSNVFNTEGHHLFKK